MVVKSTLLYWSFLLSCNYEPSGVGTSILSKLFLSLSFLTDFKTSYCDFYYQTWKYRDTCFNIVYAFSPTYWGWFPNINTISNLISPSSSLVFWGRILLPLSMLFLNLQQQVRGLSNSICYLPISNWAMFCYFCFQSIEFQMLDDTFSKYVCNPDWSLVEARGTTYLCTLNVWSMLFSCE